jgi:hypothetical protein
VTATIRNVAIVLALAAVFAFVPGGGRAGSAISQLLAIGFLGAIAWFAVRVYRERHVDLYSLGDTNRLILYASIGAVALAVVGSSRLWSTGPGIVAWFVLIGLACIGGYRVIRAVRSY